MRNKNQKRSLKFGDLKLQDVFITIYYIVRIVQALVIR